MKTNMLSKGIAAITIICLVLLNFGVNGQVVGDYRTKVSGAINWSVATNWERCITDGTWTGATSTDYPGEDATAGTVYLLEGTIVTVDVSPANAIGTLTFPDVSSATATSLTFGAAQILNVSGAVNFGNISNGSADQTITINDGTLSCTSLTMPNTGADNQDLLLTISTGTLSVTGNITMNGSSARNNITFSSTGTLNVGGDFSGGGFTCSTCTVNYNGTTAQNVGVYTYYNLEFTNTSTKTLQGNITVGGALTVNSGATFSLGTTTTSFSVAGATAIDGTLDFGDTSTKTVTLSGGLSGGGTIDMSGSSLLHTLNLGGAINAISTLTSAAVASTINYNSVGAQSVFASPNYRNLTISGGGVKTLQGDVVVNNNLSVSAGTFDFGSTVKTVTVLGDLSGAGTISMVGSGIAHIMNLAGVNNSITTFTTTPGSGSTVNYNLLGNQLVFLSSNYQNLTVSGSGTKTLGAGNITINGNLNISNATLAYNPSAARTVTVSGNLSGTGTLDMSPGTNLAHILSLSGETNSIGTLTTDPAASTINYNRSGDQEVFSSANYCNVTISGSGTKTLQGDATIKSNLTISVGTFDLGSSATTVAVNGTTTIAGALNLGTSSKTTILTGNTSVGGTLSFGAATNSLSVLGDLSGAGTIDMSSSSNNVFNLSGNNTTTGTFTAGTGTFNYNGTTQTVRFATYYNLSISGSGVKTIGAGNTTINGNLNVSDATLTYNSGAARTVTVWGNLSGNGTIDMSPGTSLAHVLYLGGETNAIGALTTDAAGNTVNYNRSGNQEVFSSTNYCNLTLSGSGTKTAAGNITFGATLNNSQILDMSTYSLTLGSTTTNTGGTIRFSGATNGKAINSGTIDYYGTGQTIATGTYTNLTLSNSSGTNTAGGNLTVNGALITTAGGTLDMSTYTLLGATLNPSAVAGIILTSNMSANPFPSGKTWGGTVEYVVSSGSQTIVSGAYNNLTLNNTSGTNTAGGNITVSGTLTTSAGGTLSMGTNIFSSLSSVTNNGIIRTLNTSATPFPTGITWGGTIEYAVLAGSQTIVSGTYNNINILNTSGTCSASGNLTINGSLTTSSGGTLNMGAYALTGAFNPQTIVNTIKTSNTSASPLPSGKTWGGTIDFALLTGSQTIVDGTYNNLTISNTSNSNSTAGDIVVGGTLATATGGILNTANNINLNGTVLCGGNINATAGTFSYGATATNILGGTYFNLVIPNNATLCGNITVNGAVTIGSGLNYNSYTISGLLAVSSVSAANVNGVYKIGDVINVTVEFSKNVTVTGIPQLTLETGSTDRTVNWDGGVVTNTLTFPYTVQAGDLNSDLDYVATNALSLNGGTIKDASNNNADITLPAPGTANSLGSNKNIAVDGVVPSLTFVHIQSNNSISTLAKVGDIITLTFTGSETLTSKPIVTIATNSIASGNVTNTGGNTWTATYTMALGDATGNIPFTIDFSDIAGNPGVQRTTVTDGSSVTFDKTVPTLTYVHIQSNNSTNSLAKVGDIVTLTFTGSEVLTTKPTVTIAAHSIDAGDVYNSGGNTWTATYTMVLADATGNVPFSIDFTDIAGNSGAQSTTVTDGSSVTFDKTFPSLSNISIQSNNSDNTRAKVGDIITLSFTGSEALTPKPTVTIASHSIAAGSITNTGGNNWTASYLMVMGDTEGTIPFTIDYTDLAGNNGSQATAITSGSNVTFDKTKPTVTISSNKTHTNNNPFTLTITFNEDVKDFLATDVNITNGTRGTFTETTLSRVWTLVVTPNGSGNIQCSISANACTDLAGNDNLASNAINVIYDIIAPDLNTVSISSNNTYPAYVGIGGKVTISIIASESILLVPGNVSIAGHTAGVTLSGSGVSWFAEYTMLVTDTEGPVSFSINFVDLAGNSGTMVNATTNGSSVLFDISKPVLSIVSIASSNDLPSMAMVGDEIKVSFTAGEKIEAVTATIKGKTAIVTNTNVGANEWEATYTMSSGDLDVPANVNFVLNFKDYAGNTADPVSATTNGSSVTFDKTKPTLSGVSISSNNAIMPSRAKSGHTVTVTFTANEIIQAPSVAIMGLAATVSNISGNQWRGEYTLDGTEPEGQVSFFINFADAAGNQGVSVSSVNNGSSVTIDNTIPILTSISIASNNVNSNMAVVGNTVTLSFTANEAIQTPLVTIAGHSTAASNTGGNSWAATYTFLTSDPEGIAAFTISFHDMVGNSGVLATSSLNGSSVTFDATVPTLPTVGISSNNPSLYHAKVGNTISIAFTSSETILLPTATIFGRAATVENISGNQWRALVTALASDPEGEILFSISFSDIAGNNGVSVNTTTNASILFFDRTNPLLSAVSISSNHTNSNFARVGSTVSLMINASETLTNISTVINGIPVTPVNIGGDNWVCNYIPSSIDNAGTIPFTIAFVDLAGNAGTPVTATTNSSQVVFDKIKPIFSSIAISTTDPFTPYVKNGSLVELSFTTDEPTENPTVRINNIFATSITGGPTNWIASRTLGAGEPPTNVFFEIFTNDMAGNESLVATTTTNSSYLIYDNTPPVVSLVTVTAGVYKVGSTIPVFIQADYNNYTGTTVEVNGKTQTLINNNNNTYIINYTVAENDNQINAQASLPTNVVLQDGSGNTTTISAASVVGASGTITVDTHTPQISAVVSNAEVDGILKIGDQLIFTVTPVVAETGLIITPTTYNGKPITWTTATGATYTATYTVVEGDATQDPPLQIGPIGIADIAGNTGTPNNYTGVLKTIYATKPTATILGTTSMCYDAALSVPITFNLTGYAPFELIYKVGSGANVTLTANSLTEIVNVTGLTEGVHQVSLVRLTDAKGNFVETATQNAVITVNSLPTVALNIVGSPFNDDAEPIYLFNFATPNSGGVFSGNGVTANGYFHPRFFDVSGGDVFVTITYTYTNSNGCLNSASNVVVVSSGGASINGLNNNYCNYDEPFTITAINPLVPTVYGTFEIKTSSTGWEDNQDNTLTITPSLIGAKTHLIEYSYWEGLTQFFVTRSFTVDSVGVNIDFLTLNNQYCKSANSVQLNAVGLYPSLGTGHFSGPSSGFSTIENSNSAIFTPEFAPLDQQFEISYYYLSPLGCSSDTIKKPTIVYSLPVVNVTVNHNYNYDGPSVQLVGTPGGGSFNIGTLPIPLGLLRPSDYNPGDYSIGYTYTETATGCTNFTSKPTRILKANDIVGLNASYCYSEEEVNISCDPVFNPSVIGTFSSNNGGIIASGIDNQAKYSIASAGKGVDTVFFRYSIEGTPYEVFKRVLIDSIGQVSITGLTPSYCNDAGQIILVGNNNNHGYGNGNFTYNGTVGAFGNAGNIAFFTPLLEQPGTYDVTYQYLSSLTTCSSQITSSVTINPVPNVQFSILQSCTGTEEPVEFINKTQSSDEIVSWFWNFGGTGSSTEISPNFTFSSTGDKDITLTASTINGCTVEYDSTITVGVVPKANFAWENECLTEQATILKSTTTESNVGNYQWVFDDGTINEGNTLNSVSHLFDGTGLHEVKLVITSTDNCKDSLTKSIYIQPLVIFNELPNNVYSQNFEAGETHWLARSLSSNNYLSWEFGKPNGDIIFEAASGENAWFTAVNFPTTLAERSEVVSPCFNFSNLEKPMLKLNIWSSPETGRDGAVLQYSTNQGLTWETLGEANKGVNWFNSTTIQSQPGGPGLFTGWSGIPMTSWQSARYKLDDVKGQPNVRFRIVYAAGGGAINYIDGFAFDDFWIGDRQQSVLVEYFTNSNYAPSVAANGNMKTLEEQRSIDAIPVHYHTFGDPVNNLFPLSSSGREFFYGLSAIPYALANGNSTFNFTTFLENLNLVDVESLQDPKMLLEVNYTDGNEVEIAANLSSLVDIDSEDLLLFCAVVQPIVNISTGETYYNVVREFLPNSAGISLQRSWVANESKSVTFTYNPSANDIANGTRIIVMVQNVATRKVYQSKSIDLTLTPKSVSTNSVISTNVFPNPAKSSVTIEGSEDIMNVSIIDLSGRTVSTTKVNGRQTTILVDGLSKGVYFMQIDFKNERTVRKFVKE